MCGVCVYERERHTDRQGWLLKWDRWFYEKRMINVRSEFEMHTKKKVEKNICSIILSNFKRHKKEN